MPILTRLPALVLALTLGAGTQPSHAQEPVTTQPSLAPGYKSLPFAAPTPGSYDLPVLGRAADGELLDTAGNKLNLHSLLGEKIVVLSFIYSTCNDVNGCPLATAVLHKINHRLQQEPELADKLRLLTISFNPIHDTPAVMKQFAVGFKEPDTDWQFFTTQSDRQLQPILKAYGQNIAKAYDAKGRDTGTFSHSLRVFLIDKALQVRNIYSTDFLHADTLINDIKTLANTAQKLASPASAELPAGQLYNPGDNKTDYQRQDYQTRSVALAQRQGKATDLFKTVRKPPSGLPEVPVPGANPLTPEKVALGRKLFYDRRLSLNNTFSCAICHIPEQGFTNNEMATAVGVEGRTVRRNAPTLYNVAYAERLFHDGRENTLEQQVWGPLLAQNEMANPAIASVVDKIKQDPDYVALFQQAFNKEPGMETIGMALASYQRTLNSANSAFDRWYFGKEKSALNSAQQRGYQLFTGKANCVKCHVIDKNFALFTDNSHHNTGIGFAQAMAKPAETQRIQVAPGVFVDAPSSVINTVAERKPNDLGRYEITQNPQDRWKYKTPSLRNISLTAPYMHNGQFGSLTEVVNFYNGGGIANENLDSLIKPLNLNAGQLKDLVSFLESLTGDNVSELVSDAFAAPIGEAQ